MSFRTNLYEQEHEKDSSRTQRHSFVNRLRTHTDGEVSINSTSFSQFNIDDSTSRSVRRGSHRFGVHQNHHHVAGEVMSGLPSCTLPIQSMYNTDRNTSPIARSFRKMRSSTWDAGHVNSIQAFRLSPRMFGSGINSNIADHADHLLEEGEYFRKGDNNEQDDISSFATSSDDSLGGEAKKNIDMDAIGIPILDEGPDIAEQETMSALYSDENTSYPPNSNLISLEEADQQLMKNLSAENSCLATICYQPIRREKSPSSKEVKRSVTFSNNIEVEQYRDLDKLNECNLSASQTLDCSPTSNHSTDHHETMMYQQQLKHEQQCQLQPRKPKHDSFFDHFNPFKNLSWSLVGSYIVRYAPCFICGKKLEVSATDRNVLMRLNMLCAFYAIIQIGLGVFLFLVTYLGVKEANEYYASADVIPIMRVSSAATDVISPDLWNLMLFVWVLSIVSLVLLLASYLAQRAIQDVNLVRSVRFMWTLFWLLPIQIFLMIGLFDYYGVMYVYTKHWWDEPGMAWFRSKCCEDGTAMTKCTVPIDGGEDYNSEEEWCEDYYNAMDCTIIRDAAQTKFVGLSYVFFTANGVWALLLVALMYVTLCVLQGIISLPIVQRSKESNIPLWLTFPIAGCFLIGVILLFGPSTVSAYFQDLYMIGLAYLVTGSLFALAAIIGISLKFYTVLNKRQKKCKQALVVAFIVTIVVTIFSVTTIFATSIIYSLNIIKIPTNAYHEIACMLDTGGSCTGCESSNSEEVCPEWSEGDVTKVLKTVMKQSATVAAIFLVYALITLRYGFLLLKHVSSYQIDYV